MLSLLQDYLKTENRFAALGKLYPGDAETKQSQVCWREIYARFHCSVS